MITITANDKKISYGIKKYLLDTDAEIKSLTTKDAPGSLAFVSSTSNKYILNNSKQWVKISGGSGSSGGSSGSDYPNPDDTFIWDGGVIE